jgi:hypothetical protein
MGEYQSAMTRDQFIAEQAANDQKCAKILNGVLEAYRRDPVAACDYQIQAGLDYCEERGNG